MINKKISKIIGPAAGIMVFMMSIGIIPVQAYAAETKSIQNEASLSKSGNVNYEIEQNGVKLTVTNVIGTKNRIKMNATITREDGFDEKIQGHRSIELNMYKEKEEFNYSLDVIDEKGEILYAGIYLLRTYRGGIRKRRREENSRGS